jgi:hypothetical protein
MAVFIITTLLVISFSINSLAFAIATIAGPTPKQRGKFFLSLIFNIAGICGVLYLASH